MDKLLKVEWNEKETATYYIDKDIVTKKSKWCRKGGFWCSDFDNEEKEEMCDCDADCKNCDECEIINKHN